MSDYLLWTSRVYGFYIVHIAHNLKHFGKALGTGLQNMDTMDNLDGHFKSLAYNIAAKDLYKHTNPLNRSFKTIHIAHKQTGYGSQATFS
jgi:hypothetical protein